MIAKDYPIQAVEYDMGQFANSFVHRSCVLSGVSMNNLNKCRQRTRSQHQFKPYNFEIAGQLFGNASKVLMKILDGALACRLDLQQACDSLAREVSTWNNNWDITMDKLAYCIKGTANYCLQGLIGDPMTNLRLTCYADAEFASDLRTCKFTSGATFACIGLQSYFPIVYMFKKQGCVSHSSTEAEIICVVHAMRPEASPSITRWNVVYGMVFSLTPNNGNWGVILVKVPSGGTLFRNPACF